MSENLNFTLVQQAKSKGGDKYECNSSEYENAEPKFVVYIPQTISRKNGKVLKNLKITISEVE